MIIIFYFDSQFFKHIRKSRLLPDNAGTDRLTFAAFLQIYKKNVFHPMHNFANNHPFFTNSPIGKLHRACGDFSRRTYPSAVCLYYKVQPDVKTESGYFQYFQCPASGNQHDNPSIPINYECHPNKMRFTCRREIKRATLLAFGTAVGSPSSLSLRPSGIFPFDTLSQSFPNRKSPLRPAVITPRHDRRESYAQLLPTPQHQSHGCGPHNPDPHSERKCCRISRLPCNR